MTFRSFKFRFTPNLRSLCGILLFICYFHSTLLGQIPVSPEHATLPSPNASIAGAQASINALRFTASDQTRANQLNDLLHLYLDASQNPSGQTLANAGGNMSWVNFTALGLAPIGAVNSQGVLGGINFSLVITRQDNDGFVWPGFTSAFWPFPSHQNSGGRIKAWEFNGTSKEGWSLVNIPNSNPSGGIWTLSVPNPDPIMISPNFSVNAFQSPFLIIAMRCLDNGQPCTTAQGGQIFWQTQADPTWTGSKSMGFLQLPAAQIPNGITTHEYAIPLYKHPQWQGTITKIRVDPVHNGQAGRTIEIDRIAMNYDSRKSVNNANFILAASQYYFTSGNQAVFTSNNTPQGSLFDRARLAMNFLDTEFGGKTNNFILVNWPGHDGKLGKVNGQLNFGHGIQSSFYDALPVGHKDPYASVYYYASLLALANMEEEAANNPNWGVPANPYSETAASYRNRANQVRAGIENEFWLPTEGRLLSWIDSDGNARDIGHVGLNLEAVFYDAVTPNKANDIASWVFGERQISTDLSRGADIYNWTFGPRMSTRDVSDFYIWPMYQWFGMNLNQGPGARWNQQVQNGGGWFWHSFYDLVSRVKTRGADNAWNRLTTILNWFQDTQDAGGFRAYYDVNPGKLQGCNSAGAIGLDCEFIENTLVPLAYLYGFMGYDLGPDGLSFTPSIPSSLTYIGAERLHYRKHFYDVTFFDDPDLPFELSTHPETNIPGFGNSAHSLKLKLGNLQPNQDYQFQITNTDTTSSTTTNVTTNANGILTVTLSIPKNADVVLERLGTTGPVVQVKDTFDTNAPNSSLVGSTASQGNQSKVWSGSATGGGVKIASDDAIYSTAGGSNIAQVGLAPGNEKTIIQANVLPKSSNGSNWIGLGFKVNNGSFFWGSNSSSLWTFLRANGRLSIKGQGTQTNFLNNQIVSSFKPNAYNRLAIKYDPTGSTKKVTVWVNQQTFGPYNITQFNPNLNVSGLQFHASSDHRLDEFEIFTGADLPLGSQARVTTPPASQNAAPGSTISFKVDPGGTAPFTYQWQRRLAGGSWQNLSGQTGRTLVLTGVTSTLNNSQYRCRVDNTYGSPATSGIATLTVTSSCNPIQITSQPNNQLNIAPGTSQVTFSVGASGTTPRQYRWQYNGQPLTDGDRGGRVTQTTTATLRITNIQASDAGNYRCVVSNNCPSQATSNSAQLTVQSSGQQPFLGQPFVIGPQIITTIQAEDFDLGGEGIAYHETTAGNVGNQYRTGAGQNVDIFSGPGGFYVGFAHPTEWTEYTTQITAGTYDIEVWTASPVSNKKFYFELYTPTGTKVWNNQSSPLTVPNTADWNHFQKIAVRNVSLTGNRTGSRILRLVHIDGSINIDRIVVRPALTPRVKDVFANHTSGASLSGTTTDSGGKTWQGSNAAVFSNPGYVSNTASSSPFAQVPFTASEAGSRAIVVEADLNVDPQGVDGWISLGFHLNNGGVWGGNGQLWLLIRRDGRWAVLANSTAHNLGSGQLTLNAAQQAGPKNAILKYNPTTRRVSAWLNGQLLLNEQLLPAGFTPNFTRVGFTTHRANSGYAAGKVWVDNFEINLD